MSFQISKSHNLMVKGLNGRALRQKLISSNISNIDTPFYKARDIDFESALIKESQKVFANEGKKLKMAKTNSMHLDALDDLSANKATIYLRDGHMARNDANTVDLDIETTEMSKNAIMFSALTNALKKDSMIFKSVIEASSKV